MTPSTSANSFSEKLVEAYAQKVLDPQAQADSEVADFHVAAMGQGLWSRFNWVGSRLSRSVV